MAITNYHTYFLQENSSVACKLGESVFAKCAVKLKPFLKQAVKSSGLSLEDYSQIVTTICNGSNGEVVHEEGNIVAEQLVCIQCNNKSSF